MREGVGTEVPRRCSMPDLGHWGIHLGLLDGVKAVASCLVCLPPTFMQLISLKKNPIQSFGIRGSVREVCKELIHLVSSSGRLY